MDMRRMSELSGAPLVSPAFWDFVDSFSLRVVLFETLVCC